MAAAAKFHAVAELHNPNLVTVFLTEKGYRTDPQTLEKSLARLTRLGIVSVSDSVYRCTCEKLDDARYSESQLLDLVGMTQSTVNGTAFYTTTPPPSVSSRGPSGS